LLCFASNNIYFCFVSLPIFFVSLQSETKEPFFASFHFTFCDTMKQYENGQRLEKLKDDPRRTTTITASGSPLEHEPAISGVK
jgi:hypothetical protein